MTLTETPVHRPGSSRVEMTLRLGLILWSALTAGALAVLARTDSYWLDELTSYWFSSGEHVGSVIERMVARHDPHPPGYQLLLFLFYRVPGLDADPLGARSLSIASYLVALLCGARLLWRRSGSYAPAVVYAVLFASATYVAYYGTELRSYMSQQAALMALLLLRDERARASRPWLHVFEQLAAFYLGFSHYVAALLVGVFVLVAGLRSYRAERSWHATLPACGYLLGPLASLAWLVFGPNRDNFRDVDVPTLTELALYFVDAIGVVQLLVLSVLVAVALGLTVRDPSSDMRPRSPSLAGLGLGEMLLFFASMLALLPLQPVFQERSVVLILPPLLCALSLLLTSTLRGRSSLILLLGLSIVAWAGISEYRSALASPERSGSDFQRIAELAREQTVVVATDDLRRKVVDAGQLHNPPLTNLAVVALWKNSKEPYPPLAEDDSKLVLACPHCRGGAAEKLDAFRKSRNLRCKKERTADRDVIFRCRP